MQRRSRPSAKWQVSRRQDGQQGLEAHCCAKFACGLCASCRQQQRIIMCMADLKDCRIIASPSVNDSRGIAASVWAW